MLASMIRRLLLALVLSLPALLSPGMAAAQDPLGRGLEAFRLRDFDGARKYLEQAVPDPRADFLLGQMKSGGLGGPVDYQGAVTHYRRAAERGHVPAMVGLGFLTDNGWGTPRDGALAQELYIAGMQGGMAMAKNNLAYLWGRQGGLLEEALCLSAETLVAEPDNPYFLDTYGFILLRLGRAAQAEAYFRKALRLLPDYADALEHLGDAASMAGRAEEARNWWRRANANPRDPRQGARVAAKLGGAPPPGDLNQHPSFTLRNPGLPEQCAMPSV